MAQHTDITRRFESFKGAKKKIRIVAKAHEHTKKDSRESVTLHTYHESRRVE
jgi:hypothetical protein